MKPSPKLRHGLSTLQAGRAVAAAAVVLYHLNIAYFGSPEYFPQPFFSPFSMGYAGVEFFFVLSGFIILHVHQRDIGRPNTLRPFITKRFRRVYPPLWIVLAGLVLLYAVIPTLGGAEVRDPGGALATFALIPAREETLLSVAWTLRHEVMFYAAFAFLLANRRVGSGLMAAWMSACLAYLGLLLLGFKDEFPLSFLLSPYNLLFLGGMFAARRYAREASPRPGLLFVLGLGLFLAIGLQDLYAAAPLVKPLRTIGFGIGATLIVIGLAELERAGRLAAPGWLKLLGDASYALYLVHIPVLSVAAKLLFALGMADRLPHAVSFFGLFVVASVAGLVFHLLFEKTLLPMLERQLGAVRQSVMSRARRSAPS